jgi:hypothetical protein
MACVPEGTRRFRLHSPCVQASGLAPEKLPFRASLQGLSQECFKTRFMQQSSELQAFNRAKIYWPDTSQGDAGYQTRKYSPPGLPREGAHARGKLCNVHALMQLGDRL